MSSCDATATSASNVRFQAVAKASSMTDIGREAAFATCRQAGRTGGFFCWVRWFNLTVSIFVSARVANPHGHIGYGRTLGSYFGPWTDGVCRPCADRNIGLITPSEALSCFPYLPDEAMRALRYISCRLHKIAYGGDTALSKHFPRTGTGMPEPILRSTRVRSSP
jgi:hypothetical protein